MSASTTDGIKILLHPVSDLTAAKPVYTALLGMPPTSDSDYYVGYEAAGQQIGLVVELGSPCVTETEKVAWPSMPVSSVKRCLWQQTTPTWRRQAF